MVIATIGTICYALPDIPMALHAAAAWVGAAAFACGAGAAVSSTFFGTALQQQVPADRLARVNSLTLFPAYGIGVIGYAIDGPLASVVGAPAGLRRRRGLRPAQQRLRPGRALGADVRWRDQAPERGQAAGLEAAELEAAELEAAEPRRGLGPADGAAEGGERGQPRDHGDDDRDREHLGQVTRPA